MVKIRNRKNLKYLVVQKVPISFGLVKKWVFCYHAYIYRSIVAYKVLSIYRVLPGFREFADFEKSKRFFILFFGWALQRGGQGPGKGPNIYIYIVYRVLSIYRFLPGFREIAFFEKSKRFFILFFWMDVTERGSGPWQGPKYIYVVYRVLSIYRFLPGFREFAFFEKSKRFVILFLDGRYREGVRALARAQIVAYIAARIYRGWHESQECTIFKLR